MSRSCSDLRRFLPSPVSTSARRRPRSDHDTRSSSARACPRRILTPWRSSVQPPPRPKEAFPVCLTLARTHSIEGDTEFLVRDDVDDCATEDGAPATRSCPRVSVV
jgi:hypothetical protein